MKQTKRRILAWLMTVVLVLSVVTVLTPAKEAEAAAATAVSTHGKLAVKGTQLVDKNGQPFQIHGVSTHGLQWFGQYNNKAAYQTLRDDWGANAIRLAMYVDEGGYYSDRNGIIRARRGASSRRWHRSIKITTMSSMRSATSRATVLGLISRAMRQKLFRQSVHMTRTQSLS